jgi:hypothetical protein
MVVELPPEIETALAAEAKSRGVSVGSLVQQLLAAFAHPSSRKSAGVWDAEIEAVLDTLPPLPVLPREALSRESMYDDAG